MKRKVSTDSVALKKEELVLLYFEQKKSVKEISVLYGCSENKINYWLHQFNIQKRSISEASYQKHNPHGDPFSFSYPKNQEESFLFGLGLGLYWGEGNKRNEYAVRLGNTDPDLVKVFMLFLERIFSVQREKMKFNIQIFNDTDPKEALVFWARSLKVSLKQFGKVVVTPSRGEGTYTRKMPYGVLSITVSNKKLRNLVCSEIEKLRKMH